MKKAIIIGASSGIGKALAIALSKKNYEIGLMARRENLLKDLQKELKTHSFIKQVDVSKPFDAIKLLQELIKEMKHVDLIIINAGIGRLNERLEFQEEKDTIDVNVTGFTAMADEAMRYFIKRKRGYLTGISSIAALRGSLHCPAYNASKAYVSNYLESLYFIAKSKNLPIHVTDIRPGFVDTEMIKKVKNTFWVASKEKAASQIVEAIEKKKKVAYITKRWSFIAFLTKIMPVSLLIKVRKKKK